MKLNVFLIFVIFALSVYCDENIESGLVNAANEDELSVSKNTEASEVSLYNIFSWHNLNLAFCLYFKYPLLDFEDQFVIYLYKYNFFFG